MPKIHTLTMNWHVLDNWSEILVGTHQLLNEHLENTTNNTGQNIIARSILLHSHQLVEIMFYNVVAKFLDENDNKSKKANYDAIRIGMDDNISFKKAMKNWPKILTGNNIDRSKEPFSSQNTLRILRNKVIHWPSGISVKNLAHSAYSTGIEASREIYSHFYTWKGSEYEKYMKQYPPSTNILLDRQIRENDISNGL